MKINDYLYRNIDSEIWGQLNAILILQGASHSDLKYTMKWFKDHILKYREPVENIEFKIDINLSAKSKISSLSANYSTSIDLLKINRELYFSLKAFKDADVTISSKYEINQSKFARDLCPRHEIVHLVGDQKLLELYTIFHARCESTTALVKQISEA